MFIPDEIFYEENIKNYELGRELLNKYKNTKLIKIDNHNNIKEMREQPNSEFVNMKKHLIIGVRKTHKFVPNNKTSDFLVPYTSSGCMAMCMYCYLVCNYNKCSYLRLFVNREEMLNKIIKTANQSEKEYTFEIGSNSDLILENTIPTKFDMVDKILKLDHNDRIIIRMSLNPEEIINKVEFGTSRLNDRINAIIKLKNAGYKVGILIAPIILVDNWRELYGTLIKELSARFDNNIKKGLFFELIFMTYSYVHRMINTEAFPNAIDLYSPDTMTGRGRGKYTYKKDIRAEAEAFLIEQMKKYFPNSEIKYIC